MSGRGRFSSRPRWGDFVAAGALLLAALAVWLLFFSGEGGARTAVLLRDGAEVRRIALTGVGEERSFEVEGENGVMATVTYAPGRVRFAASDCPDQVCVATGWLTRPGQSAVCLPGRLILRIEGEGDVDAVSG